MDFWFSQAFQVDHNCNRSGYRLRHPTPLFSRERGQLGGCHPSNVQIQPYNTPGALNIMGDFGTILFVDGVAMGGGVVPLKVILADLWKIGQAMPARDYIKFVYCTVEEARDALIAQDQLFNVELLA
jgi:allophanate hydrolase subunit 2